MSLISVLTPVHGEGVKFLADAYASLNSQILPAGWDVEWVIQHDGTDGAEAVAAHVPSDPRVTFDASRHGGPEVARTMALARSQGDVVKVLDADDQFADPAVLSRDVTALADPEVGWATSRVLDLLPDGSRVGFEGDPAAGRLPRGSVLAHWREHHRAQVHPATLCARRELVVALGGWMALPASGDTGLLIALDAVADGWFHQEVGLLYRKWPGQITAHASHSTGPEWEARMSLIEARGEALTRRFYR